MKTSSYWSNTFILSVLFDQAGSGHVRGFIPGILGDDPDKSWEWFGKHEPYYGVYAASQFRSDHLDQDNLSAFFQSGEAHVTRVLNILSSHFRRPNPGHCLDFGCGVGRLLIPLSRTFSSVTGVDVSKSMITEAERNCRQFKIENVSLRTSLPEEPVKFDLVHSYVVLQHIPVSHGELLIDQLVRRTTQGGLCFLQFTTLSAKGPWRRFGTFCRKNIKPAHYAINLARGRPLKEAYMQINEYDLGGIVAHLYDRSIRNIWLESENHHGPYSVCIAFQVP